MHYLKRRIAVMVLITFLAQVFFTSGWIPIIKSQAADIAGVELLSNTSFDTSSAGWLFYADSTAKATGARETGQYDTVPACYKIQCTDNGTTSSAIQLFTYGLKIEQGKEYELTFRAKSTMNFAIPSIVLMQKSSPYWSYASPGTNVPVTTSWQSYSVKFKANTTDSDARMTFFLGNGLPDGAAFYIDTLSLKAVGIELLSNTSFDTSSAGWLFYADSTAKATGAREIGQYDTVPACYKIQCADNGTTSSAIQLFTYGLKIEQGKEYELTFRAKSTMNFAIPSIVLMQKSSPYKSYASPSTNVSVTTSWQSYSVKFKANTTDSDARMTFFLGNGLPDGAAFYIDTLSLKAVVLQV